MKRDPLANAPEMIRRVYAYVAYRLGDGPDAEDVTSEAFERAVRYRESYDASRGEPLGWLLGIARRCVDDALRAPATGAAVPETASPQNLESEAVERLTVAAPVHMRGISDLFIKKLEDRELAVLESALAKVTPDCTFG